MLSRALGRSGKVPVSCSGPGAFSPLWLQGRTRMSLWPTDARGCPYGSIYQNRDPLLWPSAEAIAVDIHIWVGAWVRRHNARYIFSVCRQSLTRPRCTNLTQGVRPCSQRGKNHSRARTGHRDSTCLNYVRHQSAGRLCGRQTGDTHTYIYTYIWVGSGRRVRVGLAPGRCTNAWS